VRAGLGTGNLGVVLEHVSALCLRGLRRGHEASACRAGDPAGDDGERD
jgi:hypothetical protein